VGIAGAGMSGYALAAHALGAQVTGSDRAPSPYLDALARAGVDPPVIGHDAANVPPGADVEVVYSTAIPAENPERLAARERGLRERPRAELLAELTALRPTVAVAGAHGKTTTAAMIAHVLLALGLDPAFLIGGILRSAGSNAAWGGGEWLVVEADESDRSMLALDVDVAVLTNVELDHHATYGSLGELRDAYREFLSGPAQAVVWDRPALLELRSGPVVAFEPERVALSPGGSRFDWRRHEVHLGVPGAMNARNAAAALEACALAGAEPAAAAAALADFAGAARRFEHVGRTRQGAEVYDDYAHHPTEVAATLEAARTLDARRLVAAFQPHLYSRTARLAREFGAALALADLVVVLDVYAARERAEDFPAVSGLLVARAVADAAAGRTVVWAPSLQDAERALAEILRPGDLLLTLGAGDVDALAAALVAERSA
jgi:UDP-N-acetylmuramate--alanine ligase